MSNHNIRYDEEFKNDAINLILEKHHSIHSVSKDLGVSEPTLRRWIKEKTCLQLISMLISFSMRV